MPRFFSPFFFFFFLFFFFLGGVRPHKVGRGGFFCWRNLGSFFFCAGGFWLPFLASGRGKGPSAKRDMSSFVTPSQWTHAFHRCLKTRPPATTIHRSSVVADSAAIEPPRTYATPTDTASYGFATGISPAFAITGAASGEARKRSSAPAASGCCTVAGERTGEGKNRLDLGRKRADKADSGDMDQLADLLEADLRLATRDDGGHRLAGRRSAHPSALARDRFGDAELGEQDVVER